MWGELDIAAWLAENGWAEAPAGSPLAALTDKARTERRGLFGATISGEPKPGLKAEPANPTLPENNEECPTDDNARNAATTP